LDIGVLISSKTHLEGISNAILEMMAAKKPVIAKRGGGTNEIVEDGQTGFLIDKGEADVLSSRIVFLLSDESLWHKMG